MCVCAAPSWETKNRPFDGWQSLYITCSRFGSLFAEKSLQKHIVHDGIDNGLVCAFIKPGLTLFALCLRVSLCVCVCVYAILNLYSLRIAYVLSLSTRPSRHVYIHQRMMMMTMKTKWCMCAQCLDYYLNFSCMTRHSTLGQTRHRYIIFISTPSIVETVLSHINPIGLKGIIISNCCIPFLRLTYPAWITSPHGYRQTRATQ